MPHIRKERMDKLNMIDYIKALDEKKIKLKK